MRNEPRFLKHDPDIESQEHFKKRLVLASLEYVFRRGDLTDEQFAELTQWVENAAI